MSEFFAVLSNLLAVAVVVTYFRQVVKGSSTPNPSSWLLWAILSVMNAISYFGVVQENLWQTSYVLVMAIGLSAIFIFSLFKGKFAKIGAVEIICTVLAVLVGILWKTVGNADIANISHQAIFLISIFPTAFGLLHGLLREKALPWNLVVASHVFATTALITGGEFRWIALVYPVVTGIIGNGSVALIIFLQTKGVLHPRS